MKAVTILLILSVPLGAAPAAEPTAAKKPAADLCKDCIDPYAATTERGKFFTAAGVDSELTAAELKADQARKNGFVRKFDTWAGMVAFDKNGNKTLDWFEADAYRRDLRKRMLARYDTNKDRRLTGKEREQANLALAAGKLPAASSAGGAARPPIVIGGGGGQAGQITEQTRLRMFDKDRDGKLDTEEKAAADKWQADYQKRREQWAQQAAEWRKTYQELVKKHDADGDGRINEQERKGFYEDYRRIAELRQWDKDKDGKLSKDEIAAKDAQQERWRKAAEESRHRWMLQRWDEDRDGKISEAEQAAADKWQDEQRKRAEEYRAKQAEIRKQADADGDGQLNTEERKAYYEAIRRDWDLRRWDKDHDGQFSKEELAAKEAEQARWRKMSENYRAKQAELRKQADTDGDGQLNDDERKVYYDAIRRYWQVGRWDINGDGKLDDEERKAMDQQGRGWYYPAMRLRPGQPGQPQVWTSPDGRVRATIVTPPGRRRRENSEE